MGRRRILNQDYFKTDAKYMRKSMGSEQNYGKQAFKIVNIKAKYEEKH